ncbi:cc19d793-7a5e-4e17-baa0-e62bef6a48b1 [Sclerotinia trifoliorum]|uniref:Cc19d793-7a5e-4e17-baa0-e62bef6a48b1 n=1 Tax=Sclerotinia trifoliorum TaxID=28548 RepID=A0A8H2ZJ36_9HELO|nr:cc19d793-7a5e-4e17-baa0-e62bef6a48b1 [Sclerotinia trifoliorum]
MISQSTCQDSAQGLPTTNLQGLFDQDPAEATKLFDASKQYGFFYLDFGTISKRKTVLSLIDQIYRFEEELFSLPQHYLMKYDVYEIKYMKLNGYKPKGRNFGRMYY